MHGLRAQTLYLCAIVVVVVVHPCGRFTSFIAELIPGLRVACIAQLNHVKTVSLAYFTCLINNEQEHLTAIILINVGS